MVGEINSNSVIIITGNLNTPESHLIKYILQSKLVDENQRLYKRPTSGSCRSSLLIYYVKGEVMHEHKLLVIVLISNGWSKHHQTANACNKRCLWNYVTNVLHALPLLVWHYDAACIVYYTVYYNLYQRSNDGFTKIRKYSQFWPAKTGPVGPEGQILARDLHLPYFNCI